MYSIKIVNTVTKQEYTYNELSDLNGGKMLYYLFSIDTSNLDDGEYQLTLFNDDDIVCTELLKIGDYNGDKIQYSKGNNVYIVDKKTINLSSITITENGEYTAPIDGGYNHIIVDTPDYISESISITENGVYTPPMGVDGYDSINVYVVGFDFEPIGYDKQFAKKVNNIYADDIEYSKQIQAEWDSNTTSAQGKYFRNKIIFFPFINTSNVTNMQQMFQGCNSLLSVPLLDTSKVTNMYGMFSSCYSLQLVSRLDTSNVTDMRSMFIGCMSLPSIPHFNTSNVVNMENMFADCSSLTTIPLLDTSNVTTMYYMFSGCKSLTTIPSLNVSSVTNMSYMFQHCSSLETISLINTSNVTNMSSMFYACDKLQTIPMLDTSNVHIMKSTFFECRALTYIPQLNTSNVTDMDSVFYNCTSLQSIPLLDCGNVTKMSTPFGYSGIKTLTDLGGFKDLKISITIYFLDSAPNLTVESLMNVINNLYDLTSNGLSGQSLKFGSTNLNKLTAEQIAVATAKGWTITA